MAKRYRLSTLIVLVFLAYSYFVFHLYNLQVAKGKYFLAKAESQVAASELLTPERGGIFFTDKNNDHIAVATNKDFPLVYAVPKAIANPKESSLRLASILDTPVLDIQKKLLKKNDSYELLKRKASQEESDKIGALNEKGIYVQDKSERFYPFGKMAAQVLGYLGPDSKLSRDVGHYGLEEYYEDELSGIPQGLGGADKSVQSGANVNLTIDPNIQSEAERILGDTIAKFQSPGGSVIVEEPKTGKILAMASFPNFDPNSYKGYSISSFLNPVTQQLYEPGSVVKVVTMSAGIDQGKITPNTTYNDTGLVVLNGKKIHNHDLKSYGVVDMNTVINKSLNTGAVFVEQKIGESTMRSYLERFGFGQKTGIDLPGELKGDLKNIGPGARAVAFATASFGQGIAVTPLQLINAISVLANGGTLMRPYLNSDLAPKVLRESIVKPETARQVVSMMQNAFNSMSIEKLSGYNLAGKTGTAQVPDTVNGGYKDRVIDTYVGFGPVKDPKFVILVKLMEPPGNPLASQTVVPAFRDLALFILNYYNIPPDNLNNIK